MGTHGIITAIIVGLIIGGLGRLVIPGRQPIGFLLTLLIGIAAAFLGSWISYQARFGVGINIILDVVLAAIGVALVGGGMRGAGGSRRRL